LGAFATISAFLNMDAFFEETAVKKIGQLLTPVSQSHGVTHLQRQMVWRDESFVCKQKIIGELLIFSCNFDGFRFKEYRITIEFVFLELRAVSSVGLERYFDRVEVTGSSPVQPTDQVLAGISKL
jgi:hypothetical protein